jgi:hypothetical protein
MACTRQHRTILENLHTPLQYSLCLLLDGGELLLTDRPIKKIERKTNQLLLLSDVFDFYQMFTAQEEFRILCLSRGFPTCLKSVAALFLIVIDLLAVSYR